MSWMYEAYSHLWERNWYYMVYCWFQIWAWLAYLSYFLPFKFGYQKWARDIICKLPTISHGLIIFISWYAYLIREGFLFGDVNTQFQIFVFEISWGYYLADIAVMFMIWKFNIEIIVHHLIVIIGFLTSFITGYGGHEIMSCIWWTEISNLVMYLKFILKDLEYTHIICNCCPFIFNKTQLYIIVEIVFWVVFVIGRVIVGSIVVYNMNFSLEFIKRNWDKKNDWLNIEEWWRIVNNCPLFVKLSGTAVLILSLYYAIQMPKKLFNKIAKQRLEIKKKI